MLGAALLIVGAYMLGMALDIWWGIRSGRPGPLHKVMNKTKLLKRYDQPAKWGTERAYQGMSVIFLAAFGAVTMIFGIFQIWIGT